MRICNITVTLAKKILTYIPLTAIQEKDCSSIKIGTQLNIMNANGMNVIVDGLQFRYAAGSGIDGSIYSTTIQNCVFCWIGGNILKGHAGGYITGAGNAIQSYGATSDFSVKNYIYHIFHTGIAHQFSEVKDSSPLVIMENIEYADNLTEYCHGRLNGTIMVARAVQ